MEYVKLKVARFEELLKSENQIYHFHDLFDKNYKHITYDMNSVPMFFEVQ